MERWKKKVRPSTNELDIVSELVPGFHGEGGVGRDAGFYEIQGALEEHFIRVHFLIDSIAYDAAERTIFQAEGERFLRKHPKKKRLPWSGKNGRRNN